MKTARKSNHSAGNGNKIHEVMKAPAGNIPDVLIGGKAARGPKGADLGFQDADGHSAGIASTAAAPEPVAAELGFRKDGEFSPLDTMVMLSVSGDRLRRLDRLAKPHEFNDAMRAAGLIMRRRLMNDFPECGVALVAFHPRGHIGVAVENAPSYVQGREFLQRRLDDACAMLADCLGV